MRDVNDCTPEEMERQRIEPWQKELLGMNPWYCAWGNFEDYMMSGSGWSQPYEAESWKEFMGDFSLDNLNELANFYFSVRRPGEDCYACEGHNLNQESLAISEGFYDFDNKRGDGGWHDKITQDEVEALQARNRLRVLGEDGWVKREGLTAEEVNAANKKGGLGNFNHDAINRWILIETRAKRLGVWGECKLPTCDGGVIWTSDKAQVSLQLWMLHPRKGCSRGVLVHNIQESDLPRVFAFLRTARERNAERFSKIPGEGQ